MQNKKWVWIFVLLLIFTGAAIMYWYSHESTLSYEVLKKPLLVQGTKEFAKNIQPLDRGALMGKDVISISYDLQGVCILRGPASEISLVSSDEKKYSVSLADYGQNCTFGEQTVKIPLKDFSVDQSLENIASLQTGFWYPTSYTLTIEKISADRPGENSLATATENLLAGGAASRNKRILKTSRNVSEKIRQTNQSPTPPLPTTGIPNTPPSTGTVSSNTSVEQSAPTPPPTSTVAPSIAVAPTSGGHFWAIRSVSSMKETKDKVCGQDSPEFISSWLDKAVELGVNYVAVETPYDNPACGSSVSYTKLWVDAVHTRGLNVWHRHAPLAFEGIYDTPKDASKNYLTLISEYIKANPTFFRAGDIFTPIPEPQNGGITGITYCPQNICIFSGAAEFNQWLRDAMTTSDSAFQSIGLGGKMKIGYFGFDGFVAWGDNNPDWHGILEDSTVAAMGNITIDHYPEIVGDTMTNDLNEIQTKYPNTPIVIGEWGTITGGDIVAQVINSMGAALRKNIIGFNYWHLGLGGNESLINDDMSNKSSFDAVKSFFAK